MKTPFLALFVGLFIVLYYLLWALTLPFFMTRLFLNAVSGEDDDLQPLTTRIK